MRRCLLALSLALGLAVAACGQQVVYHSYPTVVYAPAAYQTTYTPVYYAPVYYAPCYYQTVWPAWNGPRLVW